MSAPRKIWAYDDGLNSPDSRSWSATVPVGPAYHHDDVVRELVEAAEQMLIEYDEVDIANGEPSSLTAAVFALRAALAKIAQEDLR